MTTLTGGKRARRVLERCAEELGAMVTATGKRKSGGRYEQAVKVVEQLDDHREKVREKMGRARAALEERRSKQHRYQALTDPEEEEREKERLSAAQEAKEAAEKYQVRVEKATAKRDLARLEREAAQSERDAFGENCNGARAREKEREELQKLLPERREASTVASTERDRRGEQAQQAEEARQAAKECVDTARKAQEAQDARERHGELAGHLTKAEAAEKEAGEKRAAAKALGVRQDDIDELGRLSLAIDKAENALHAVSTRMRMRYEPGYSKRITMGKLALEDEAEVLIEQATVLSIYEVGELAIAPGAADRGVAAQRRLRDAREALADKLKELNCKDPEQARQRRDKEHKIARGGRSRRIPDEDSRPARDCDAAGGSGHSSEEARRRRRGRPAGGRLTGAGTRERGDRRAGCAQPSGMQPGERPNRPPWTCKSLRPESRRRNKPMSGRWRVSAFRRTSGRRTRSSWMRIFGEKTGQLTDASRRLKSCWTNRLTWQPRLRRCSV